MKNVTLALCVLIAAVLSACATKEPPPAAGPLKWTAHGYLTPGANGDPEVIGTYASEAECLDAVDSWMSRQVVGNPVSGECLPTDRR